MDKFSQLIKKGVAKFEYTPIAQEIPNQCPICRAYNNVYSLANDTHMAVLPDGRYVITGHAIRDKKNFDMFLYSSFWGWMNFNDSGLGAPCCFFSTNKLTGHYDILNGDDVYILEPVPAPEDVKNCECLPCPDCVCCAGTAVPEKLAALTTDGDARHIQECFRQTDVVKALNEDLHVVGTNWMMVNLSTGKHVVSIGKNKTYIL